MPASISPAFQPRASEKDDHPHRIASSTQSPLLALTYQRIKDKTRCSVPVRDIQPCTLQPLCLRAASFQSPCLLVPCQSTQADKTTVSGEAPEEPVVSKKTGTVFEKRLIEKYIEENGKDPITGDELDPEDLLPVQSARVVRPRAPNLTSIPALLSTFQNEWDALALETFKLKQQLSQTRDELANALYQHDAAVRVIARVTRERDEARAALSRVTVSAGSASGANGDAMAVDNETLPEELAAHVDETQAKYVNTCWNNYYAPPPDSDLMKITGCPRAARRDRCPAAGPAPTRLQPLRHGCPSRCRPRRRRRSGWRKATRPWAA